MWTMWTKIVTQLIQKDLDFMHKNELQQMYKQNLSNYFRNYCYWNYELFMFFISIDEIKTSLYFSYDSTKSYYFWK